MPIRSIVRRDPYTPEVFDFRRNFDDLFSRLFIAPAWDRWSNANADLAWVPAADCFIDKNNYHIQMALPGVKPGEVNLQVHGNELRISGERKQELTPSEDRSFQREITYGAFERMIPLPEGVQSEKMEANFVNGVLEITAPLSEKALPRRIEIKADVNAHQGKKLAA